GPFSDPRWLRAVLEISMHVLPHACRDLERADGTTIAIRVTGPASGAWHLRRERGSWIAHHGDPPAATATLTMPDEIAWRLFFNALTPADVESRVQVEGDATLARPILRARAVIV